MRCRSYASIPTCVPRATNLHLTWADARIDGAHAHFTRFDADAWDVTLEARLSACSSTTKRLIVHAKFDLVLAPRQVGESEVDADRKAAGDEWPAGRRRRMLDGSQ